LIDINKFYYTIIGDYTKKSSTLLGEPFLLCGGKWGLLTLLTYLKEFPKVIENNKQNEHVR
jgi:hypothetical protein